MAFVTIYIIIWQLFDPVSPVLKRGNVSERGNPPIDVQEMVTLCQTKSNSAVWTLGLIGTELFVLLMGCYLAFQTRHVNDYFQESRHIATSINALVLVSGLSIPVVLLGGTDSRPDITIMLSVLAVLFGAMTTAFAIFVPKIMRILNNISSSSQEHVSSQIEMEEKGKSARIMPAEGEPRQPDSASPPNLTDAVPVDSDFRPIKASTSRNASRPSRVVLPPIQSQKLKPTIHTDPGNFNQPTMSLHSTRGNVNTVYEVYGGYESNDENSKGQIKKVPTFHARTNRVIKKTTMKSSSKREIEERVLHSHKSTESIKNEIEK